jgi:hypothetical protein
LPWVGVCCIETRLFLARSYALDSLAACVKYGVSPRSVDGLGDLDSQLRAIKKKPVACVSNRGLSSEAWSAFQAFYKYWLQDSGLSK